MAVNFPEFYDRSMDSNPDTPLKKRIRERMDLLGINALQTAKKSGLGDSFVRDILRGKTRNPSAANLAKLAVALETTADALMGQAGETPTQIEEVPVTGLEVVSDVQAGSWLEVTELDDADHEVIPVAHDPRFPHARQYALRIRGDSMDLEYPEGCFVTCVDFWDSGIAMREGLHVHVERNRDNGQLVEITIKAIERRDGVWFLVPLSSNPRWTAVAVEGDETTKVDIKGLVTGSWKPTVI
jgi:SOS-response transcriptional repressor LexA